MKRKMIFTVCLLSMFILCGCGKDIIQKQSIKEWIINADLSAKETKEELYEKALKEDSLVIYSESSRIIDVKTTFEKEYPGLTVFVHDVKANDILEMLRNNNKTGNYDCDLVLCSNDDGQISNEFLANGLLNKYVPYDMTDKFYPYCNKELLSFVGEVEQVFYNSKVYEESPIHNWWELTQDKYYGKVYLGNPLKSVTLMGLFSMFIKENEKMEQAYYQLYGKELVLLNGETAGEAFIRMLMKNGAICLNSSDEIVEKVGDTEQDNPPLGILISSKQRMIELGYEIAPINYLEPFTGTYAPNSIMIAGGSKNINTAKLFLRWIYGEADGQGMGYKPYLTKGTWSARTDIKSESEIPLEDMNLLQLDTDYIYQNKEKTKAYWLKLIEEKSYSD